MLSEAVLASYSKEEDDGIHHGQLTVTSISPCPYATYLNYHHLDPHKPEEDTTVGALARLRMSDGHWQEMQCIENLRHAGFKMRCTGAGQQTVHVGKSQVTGRTDGYILVDGREDILSVKAMSLNRYTDFRQEGFKSEPMIECQEQMYLASDELKDSYKGTWVYSKHKDSCRPYDVFVEQNLAYSSPIIEALDEIVLGNAEIKRPADTIELCEHCSHMQYCWKAIIVDLSKVPTKVPLPDLVAKWKEAKYHQDYGKELMESVREGPGGFRELLGDKKILLADTTDTTLKVSNIVSHRTVFSETRFVAKFGAAALVDVTEEKETHSMRILEVND
jgi:hypothetical protein